MRGDVRGVAARSIHTCTNYYLQSIWKEEEIHMQIRWMIQYFVHVPIRRVWK
jgi:hypothetical protein